MKKLIFIAALAACFGLSDAKAQNVNGRKLTDIHVDYIQVRAEKSLLANKQWIIFEYGQKKEIIASCTSVMMMAINSNLILQLTVLTK